MNANIYQHFRPAERPLIDQLSGVVAQAESEYRPVTTHFLDPRAQYILRTLAGSSSVKVAFFGGYSEAERCRALVFPDYFSPRNADFAVTPLTIRYPVKFATLAHRQILGTLLNSGIDRNVLGDIISDGTVWQFMCEQRIATYLQTQVVRIGQVKVSLVPTVTVITPQSDWQPVRLTVASIRLDVVIAAVFNFSRQRVREILTHQFVRVNWSVVDQGNYSVAEYDIISVRKAGRFRITRIASERTKKGKLCVSGEVIHSHR
ncbi:RNA-binding protein [Ligilactobacillus sp. LYQ112]|uniref:YlmH family RNA-binding protein n=1 Tax=Ligilactobacillus sp. LYQ112 TaxID=3391060 RepID=UPI003983D7DF